MFLLSIVACLAQKDGSNGPNKEDSAGTIYRAGQERLLPGTKLFQRALSFQPTSCKCSIRQLDEGVELCSSRKSNRHKVYEV